MGRCSGCGENGHYVTTCPAAASAGKGKKTKGKKGGKKGAAKKGSKRARDAPKSNPLVAVPVALTPAQKKQWIDEVENAMADTMPPNVTLAMKLHVAATGSADFEDEAAEEAAMLAAPVSQLRKRSRYADIQAMLVQFRRTRPAKPPAGTLNPVVSRAGFVKAPRTLDDDWGSGATLNNKSDGFASAADYAGALMDMSLPLTGFSITVVKTGGNIPKTYFDSAVKFLDEVVLPAGGRGGVGQEAGTRRGHIHLQMTCELRTTLDGSTTKRLKKMICEDVLPHVQGRRVQVKPFGPFQDINTMIGYCMACTCSAGGGARGVFQAGNHPHAGLRACVGAGGGGGAGGTALAMR